VYFFTSKHYGYGDILANNMPSKLVKHTCRVVIMVLLMNYVIMPVLAKLLRPWLIEKSFSRFASFLCFLLYCLAKLCQNAVQIR
jgi:hypothetical protein